VANRVAVQLSGAPNKRSVAVAGPRVLAITDLGSLCPASARVLAADLAGVAGLPAVARGNVVEGERDPVPAHALGP